jgi:hypothetical protein
VHPTEHRTLAELWRELQAAQPHEMRPVELGWIPALGRRT